MTNRIKTDLTASGMAVYTTPGDQYRVHQQYEVECQGVFYEVRVWEDGASLAPPVGWDAPFEIVNATITDSERAALLEHRKASPVYSAPVMPDELAHLFVPKFRFGVAEQSLP